MRKMPARSNLRATVAVLRRRLADDKGATAIEYALIAAGIGVAVAATVTNLGSATANLFASVSALF